MDANVIIAILGTALGGVGILEVIKFIRDWNADKRLKKLEVNDKKNDIAKEDMELSVYFRDEMVKTINMLNEQGGDNKKILELVNNIFVEVADIKSRVSAIEGCMNGTLVKYKLEHNIGNENN